MRVAVASSSALAAEAGAALADAGGNAVDAALASAIVAATTEPGVSSLAGGGFVTVWPPHAEPVVIDGYAAVPGLGSSDSQPELRQVTFPYGGGVTTKVGHGSVATPGSPAAMELAHRHYGRASWRELFGPAIDYAHQGFPMPAASHRYLLTSYGIIYGEAERSVLEADGQPARPGTTVVIPGLRETLDALASQGVEAFYRGDIAHRIVEEMAAFDGPLSLEDLRSYEAIRRRPLRAEMNEWTVATNPPPAVGGATLAAMLILCDSHAWSSWGVEEVSQMLEIQAAVLGHRRRRLDVALDPASETDALLAAARRGDMTGLSAGSTSHTSAVDETGLACAVTVSMGYGAGVVPADTGLWLNNHVGELELNRFGTREPGRRLSSNMAPTVGRREDGAVLAIGSPGADRIPTALVQVLVNLIKMDMSPDEAVTGPRLHLEQAEDELVVAYEPGLPVELLDVPARRFTDLDMFFGGVALATRDSSAELSAAADIRREGSTAYR